jgi:hypothetical protein
MSIRENMVEISMDKIKENNLLKYAVEELAKKVSMIDIKTTTLPEIIKEAMQIVEKTTIKGTKQREFVIKVLRKLFESLTDNEEEKLLLQLIDNGTVSNMIDLIVDATKGKLDINVAVKTTSNLLLLCIPYITKRCNKKKN